VSTPAELSCPAHASAPATGEAMVVVVMTVNERD
jgi:hypothetical protein